MNSIWRLASNNFARDKNEKMLEISNTYTHGKNIQVAPVEQDTQNDGNHDNHTH